MSKDEWVSDHMVSYSDFYDKRNTCPRYMLIQYVQDSWRQEVRNIGVLVWSPEGVSACFRGESLDEPGILDNPPSFVLNQKIYAHWVKTWRFLISGDAIKPLKGGTLVPIRSVEFLAEFSHFSNESFVLSPGGFLEDIASHQDACEYLFDIFVLEGEDTASTEPSKERVDWELSKLFKQVGTSKNPRLKKDYSIPVNEEDVTFSYGMEMPSDTVVVEIVPLPSSNPSMNRSALSAAWKFEHVGNRKDISEKISLVHVSQNRIDKDTVKKILKLLRNRSLVLNLATAVDKEEMRTRLVDLVNADSKPAEEELVLVG